MTNTVASKHHTCAVCMGKIKIGESYFSQKMYHPYFNESTSKNSIYTNYYRECNNCVDDRAKRDYKRIQHERRAVERTKNCPDSEFKYVWQGGWDGEVADGGDVRLECHRCNLHCCR